MLVADNLEWKHVYWVRGDVPKSMRVDGFYMVKDPPCSGWQHAFIIPGEKRTTIFCPYSMTAFHVKSSAREVTGAAEPKQVFSRTKIVGIMKRQWEQFQTMGQARDYDIAVKVFKLLGEEAPAEITREGEEDTKVRGGKETLTKLLKPVKRSSKRGKFLEWFLHGPNGASRSIREAMAEFDMSRSNALSYLYMIQKDHGIGYDLVGDVATINLPSDCADPFDVPAVVEEVPEDDWLATA